MLSRLLAHKPGPVPADFAAQIEEAASETLEHWVVELAVADTLAEVFAEG